MIDNDSIKVTGQYEFILRDKFGKIKQHFVTKNLVVQGGRELIASQLCEEDIGKPSHMAVGESDQSPALSDTTLYSEIARVALTSSNRSQNTVTYEATFAPAVGTGAIVEVGMFNAASEGTMLSRTVFPVVNNESADELTVRWNVTIN